jgi:Na+-driven multidrug efflux pump
VALAILVLNAAFIVGNSGVFLAAVAAVAVALFIAVARMIYLRNEKRSRQQ